MLTLVELLNPLVGGDVVSLEETHGGVYAAANPLKIVGLLTQLRDDARFSFDMLVDIVGVDASGLGGCRSFSSRVHPCVDRQELSLERERADVG